MTPIVLDTTIAELFRQNGVNDAFVVTMHCVFGHMDLHPKWRSETVYPEDEEPVQYSASEVERNQLRKLVLGSKVVRRAFVVGNMKVLLFQPYATTENVDRVYTRLLEYQRPQPLYINLDVDDVHRKLSEETKGHKLLFWRPQGWMDKHDCLLSPALTYNINSKIFLITSGIQTPRTTVSSIPDDGVKQILNERSLPFVVKLPQACSGSGTHIVTTESRRKIMLQSMSKYAARGGTEILVSDYVDVVHNLSVHLFIGPPQSFSNKYRPTVLGVAIQDLTTDGHWTGSSIEYSKQEEYSRLLGSIIRDTTARLPDAFIGCCGLDIVIGRDGEQWVVDLNARFTGSMPICLLSTHFWKQRGLSHAKFATFIYKGDVQTAYDVLESELEDGSVVVLGVVCIDQGLAAIELVWGGRSSHELQQRAAHIRERLRIG